MYQFQSYKIKSTGSSTTRHLEYRCKSRACRVGHRHGYTSTKESLVYTNPLQNEFLVTSQNTAFQVRNILAL
jgi:hypothetical protein